MYVSISTKEHSPSGLRVLSSSPVLNYAFNMMFAQASGRIYECTRLRKIKKRSIAQIKHECLDRVKIEFRRQGQSPHPTEFSVVRSSI
jgi:hypothetical protein